MTQRELKQIHMLGIARDALDTARNALHEINLECELIDSLIQEVNYLADSNNGITISPPPPYERPTTEGLTFSPDTRDVIGYIQYPRTGFSGIEKEFLSQINPQTARTLHMKRGFKFLVAFKNGRKWEFLDPIDSIAVAMDHLSNHKGKLRMLIHYASNT